MITFIVKVAIIIAIFWGLTILGSYAGLVKSKNKAMKKSYRKKNHKRN